MTTYHVFIVVLLFLSLTCFSFSERCHPDDKKALLRIKEELKNPFNWKPNTDCCDWLAVTCDKETNRTVNFIVNYNHLQVPFPPSLGDLPYLKLLIFRRTRLTGQIPESISKLSNLDFFDIQRNLLTGPVPSFLSKLKKITYIDLSYNRLTGSIPPSLSQLPELYSLVLDGNKLTGSIPESFGDFKQTYIALFLARNQLTGPIPRTLGSGNLFRIYVSGNRLEGDISFMFAKKDNRYLTTADFSRNLFKFDLSKLEFPETLEELDLNHNRIYGSIPKGLANLTALKSLNLSYNSLCGKIPVGGRLHKFNSTSYSHNKCLCGSPLPNCT